MSNEENSLYESLIPRSPQTSQAPQTYEEVFDKKTEEFNKKRAELDKAIKNYMEGNFFSKKIFHNYYENMSSNYQKLCNFYNSNDAYQKHVNALKEAFEEHQKNGQVFEEKEQLIQDFKKAYSDSLKSAGILGSFKVAEYSSKAIAIFKEEPKEGIKILKLCTKFLKAHNEYEQAWIKMEQAQQQASQSHNTTLSGSHVDTLARNRANSNSNSNENSR